MYPACHPHQDDELALWARGFVRPYGTSDIDDDWNTYAEVVCPFRVDTAVGVGARLIKGHVSIAKNPANQDILLAIQKTFRESRALPSV